MTLEDLPRLTPKQRQVVSLMLTEKLTTGEVAKRLGWKPAHVYVFAWRARQRIKKGSTTKETT